MMYDTVDTVYDCVRIATGVLSTIKIRPERMLKGAPLPRAQRVSPSVWRRSPAAGQCLRHQRLAVEF